MAGLREEILARLNHYANGYGCSLQEELGFGWDGIVFATDCQSVLKGLRYAELFQRERDVYMRLQEHGVLQVRDFAVPQLVRSDEELWVVEMTIVRPPFVLDFAGAYLDQRPDYPPEVMAQWRAEKREQFGDRWPEVQNVMAAFARMGIYLADVKPGNIEFAD